MFVATITLNNTLTTRESFLKILLKIACVRRRMNLSNSFGIMKFGLNHGKNKVL